MGIFYTTPTKDSTGPAYTASFSVKRKPQGAGQGLCPAGTQEIRLGRANKRVFNLVYVLAVRVGLAWTYILFHSLVKRKRKPNKRKLRSIKSLSVGYAASKPFLEAPKGHTAAGSVVLWVTSP